MYICCSGVISVLWLSICWPYWWWCSVCWVVGSISGLVWFMLWDESRVCGVSGCAISCIVGIWL